MFSNHSVRTKVKQTAVVLRLVMSIISYQEGHPSPGQPFHGGKFESFLPDCEMARKLLPRLEKAFRCGLTFTVTGKEEDARVTWDCIPHKTSLHGGKSG